MSRRELRRSSASVREDLKGKGRRPATAAETLLYGIMNPEVQRTCWVVGLGQVWVDPDDSGVVVVLYKFDRERSASLVGVSAGWLANYRFLSFPL